MKSIKLSRTKDNKFIKAALCAVLAVALIVGLMPSMGLATTQQEGVQSEEAVAPNAEWAEGTESSESVEATESEAQAAEETTTKESTETTETAIEKKADAEGANLEAAENSNSSDVNVLKGEFDTSNETVYESLVYDCNTGKFSAGKEQPSVIETPTGIVVGDNKNLIFKNAELNLDNEFNIKNSTGDFSITLEGQNKIHFTNGGGDSILKSDYLSILGNGSIELTISASSRVESGLIVKKEFNFGNNQCSPTLKMNISVGRCIDACIFRLNNGEIDIASKNFVEGMSCGILSNDIEINGGKAQIDLTDSPMSLGIVVSSMEEPMKIYKYVQNGGEVNIKVSNSMIMFGVFFMSPERSSWINEFKQTGGLLNISIGEDSDYEKKATIEGIAEAIIAGQNTINSDTENTLTYAQTGGTTNITIADQNEAFQTASQISGISCKDFSVSGSNTKVSVNVGSTKVNNQNKKYNIIFGISVINNKGITDGADLSITIGDCECQPGFVVTNVCFGYVIPKSSESNEVTNVNFNISADSNAYFSSGEINGKTTFGGSGALAAIGDWTKSSTSDDSEEFSIVIPDDVKCLGATEKNIDPNSLTEVARCVFVAAQPIETSGTIPRHAYMTVDPATTNPAAAKTLALGDYTPAPSPEPSPTADSVSSNSASTGDTSPIVAVCGLALAALASGVIARRRVNN